MLPGLEMAYRAIGAEIQRVRAALGIFDEEPVPLTALPEPEKEEDVVQLPTSEWPDKGKFDRPILHYMTAHGGVLVSASFHKAMKVPSRSGPSKTIASTIHRLLVAGLIQRTAPGTYRLIENPPQAKKPSLSEATRRKLSHVAKQRWTNLSAAAKKKRRDILEAGKVKARAARARAAKAELAAQKEEAPAA
jgi:hypothetical protein